MSEMTDPTNSKKALNTLMAITSITLLSIVGVFAVSQFDLNGETLKFIVALAIIAVAGLGGYEIREQMRQT